MVFNSSLVECQFFYNGNTFSIIGRYKKKCKIEVLIDGKKKNLIDNITIDRNYIVNRVLNKNNNYFNYYIECPKKKFCLEVLINKKTIYSKEINKLNLLKKNIYSSIKKFFLITKTSIKKLFSIIKRVPKELIKTIRILWTRHHFLIPPKMIKQYYNSFFRDINKKKNDELYYNPLLVADYQKWIEEQPKENACENFDYQPYISIIIPVYNVSKKLLCDCLDSVLNQSYKNFEVCIADDNSSLEETIQTLKEYEKKYTNIKVVYRKENGHISKASNSAIGIAKGEFIGFVDNDDVLDNNALYEIVKKLNEDSKLNLIYTDEDKLNSSGERCYPHFKPDFSIDTFLTGNYFCHFTVIRKSIVDKINGFRSEYDGSQDYDLFLRVVDHTNRIGHIPKVLYHWRMTENSTASTVTNKSYAYSAGKRALEDYFSRNKIKANVQLLNEPRMYKIKYLYDNEPIISIIILTRDESKNLDCCLKSIFNKTNYSNFEVIVIDNNSVNKKTFDVLEKYKKKYNNFQYYRYECEFNYSYLSNEGVKKANGDYVVLLNSDTKIIYKNWLQDMVGYAMQKHIGCVGAKLLYRNKTVQHCGVVIGVGGIASHAFSGTSDKDFGYFGRLSAVYNWSGITSACLLISRDKYLEVNGFDENLKTALNDVDFCMKLSNKGYNHVVIPHVKIYHYESLSRGSDLIKNQNSRFINETNYMCDKWKTKLLSDKFYNNNFSYSCAFRLDKKED